MDMAMAIAAAARLVAGCGYLPQKHQRQLPAATNSARDDLP